MKKKLLAGLATGLFIISTAEFAGAASITVYTDLSSWEAAVGSYQVEDFNDSNLLPGLSYSTTSGGYISSSGYFYDRPTVTNGGTTWSFGTAINSLGGLWDLTPGGPGRGLLLTMSDGTTTFFAPEIDRDTNGFWGFVSDTSFTSVYIAAGSQFGFAETYHLDDLVYGDPAPVPEPATMLLLGTGLAGLIGTRVRGKKKSPKTSFIDIDVENR